MPFLTASRYAADSRDEAALSSGLAEVAARFRLPVLGRALDGKGRPAGRRRVDEVAATRRPHEEPSAVSAERSRSPRPPKIEEEAFLR